MVYTPIWHNCPLQSTVCNEIKWTLLSIFGILCCNHPWITLALTFSYLCNILMSFTDYITFMQLLTLYLCMLCVLYLFLLLSCVVVWSCFGSFCVCVCHCELGSMFAGIAFYVTHVFWLKIDNLIKLMLLVSYWDHCWTNSIIKRSITCAVARDHVWLFGWNNRFGLKWNQIFGCNSFTKLDYFGLHCGSRCCIEPRCLTNQ